MIIDESCIGKKMWRQGFFGKQIFTPLHIIKSTHIMHEKIVGLDGGKWIGFGYYKKIVMYNPDLTDWNFFDRKDYCVKGKKSK